MKKLPKRNASIVQRTVSATTTTGLVNAILAGKPTAEVGDYSTAVAGDSGIAQAGTVGAAIVGDGGEATVKQYGVAFAGDNGFANGGAQGVAAVANLGFALSGDGGVSVSMALGRDPGVAKVGGWGVAIAFDGGHVSAGKDGIIIIGYLDEPHSEHWTFKIGCIGQDGLQPDMFYRLNEERQFVPDVVKPEWMRENEP